MMLRSARARAAALACIAASCALAACAPPRTVAHADHGAAAADAAAATGLLTAPERTDFRETTRYDEVMAWLHEVARRSPFIRLDTMGTTVEGRPIPLAIVARPGTAARTTVYLQGNIHAGEVEGKEVALMLLRDVAEGRRLELLDSLVLIVAPIYNADGNERVTYTNRPRQHGPVGGMGQRANAQGLDLNRDHTKLASPEARGLARMLAAYDPHVFVDLHTTNGTHHAYHLTYAPPLHPNTHPRIIELLRGDLLPRATQRLRERYDWELYYYGDAYGEDERRGWYTFDHRPRFSTNYAGLRNRLGILSEAYAYLTFEDRILATARFVDEILAWSHANAGRIRAAVEEADATPIVGASLALRATFERSARPVEILMGAVAEERHPVTGDVMFRRLPVRTPEMMYEYGTFTPTESGRVPWAWILTPDAPADVIENLAHHGIAAHPLRGTPTVRVEAFRVDSSRVAERVFQGRRERTVFGAWEARDVTLPAGSLVIPAGQPLGRLAFTLLEPRSDDGLVTWNLFDAALDAGRPLPLLRVHDPVPTDASARR